MPIETWLPIVVSGLMFVIALITFIKNSSSDTKANATERATLTADVRYIRTSVDEIKLENRNIRNDLDEVKIKVAEIEASARSAHKRIDDLKG